MKNESYLDLKAAPILITNRLPGIWFTETAVGNYLIMVRSGDELRLSFATGTRQMLTIAYCPPQDLEGSTVQIRENGDVVRPPSFGVSWERGWDAICKEVINKLLTNINDFHSKILAQRDANNAAIKLRRGRAIQLATELGARLPDFKRGYSFSKLCGDVSVGVQMNYESVTLKLESVPPEKALAIIKLLKNGTA